jgi:hypothetical protein
VCVWQRLQHSDPPRGSAQPARIVESMGWSLLGSLIGGLAILAGVGTVLLSTRHYRRAVQVAAKRDASFWPWQRTPRAVRLDAVIFFATGLYLVGLGVALIVGAVTPPDLVPWRR